MMPIFDMSFIDQIKRFSNTELQSLIQQCMNKTGRVHNALRTQAQKELFNRLNA